ncbi:hypothetical protein OCF84_20840 (plasmid) [Shewanella xiamenensis]|uniref:Type II secretion system protein GspF domain-containing protein n=1 Tax=Shewanella xiamenensis TaxID=332186 RepID=A0ABT6UFN6_9GAMM|nr:hypothetical protein [Shewanella xiamenensis]MDI5833284.1 hypothetical protein [Shewanella xiamenensis]WHF57966.1 hypothetical protein OCF84_20840 [Shewanella xiamenensis]
MIFPQLKVLLSTSNLRHLINTLRIKILFNEKKQIEYLTNLGAWIQDEIKPVDAVLAIIQTNAENNRKNDITTEVSQSIYEALDSGRELHTGMVGYFSESIISIFKSAGTAGIELVLKQLKSDTDDISKLKMSFIKPIILPLSYLFAMFGSSVIIVTTTFPAISKGKEFHQWPIEAQNFSNFVYFVINYWAFFIIGIALLFFYSIYFLRNSVSEFRRELDTLPGFVLYRVYCGNVFLKNLSLMLLSNMSLIDALEKLEENSSKYVSWHASQAILRLDRGMRELGDILNTGLISGDVLILMKYLTSTESHGAKVEGLRKTASRTLAMTERKLKVSSYFLAVVIGLLVVTMLLYSFISLITMSLMR